MATRSGKNDHATERVLRWLLKHIEKNRLKPGDSLPKELDIAAAVNCGRSSVREALTALKALGILVSRRKGGIRLVREPVLLELREYLREHYDSRDQLDEATEFRSILELGLAELVFTRITKKNIAELRRIVEAVPEHCTNAQPIFDAEREFHTLLTAVSGNHLVRLLSALYTPVFDSSFYTTAMESTYPSEWKAQHLLVVEALEKRKRDQFLKLMNEHTRGYIRFGKEK